MNKKFFQHILIIICLFFIGMVSVSAENCTSVKSDIDLYDTYEETLKNMDCTNTSDITIVNTCNDTNVKKNIVITKLMKLKEQGKICKSEKSKADKIIEDNKDKCGQIFNDDFNTFVNNAMMIFYIIGPILLILFGSLDYAKATVSSEADALKKASVRFSKRIAATLLLFLTPTIIDLILSFNVSDKYLSGNAYTCDYKYMVFNKKYTIGYKVPSNNSSTRPSTYKRCTGPSCPTYIWMLPASDTILTDRFGYREQPTAGASNFHQGADIGANMGDNVYAIADGEITHARCIEGGLGCNFDLTVTEPGGHVIKYTFGHNNDLLVSTGDKVKQGDVLAHAGSTGVSTGPHCHFEAIDVTDGGIQVNALLFAYGTTENIPAIDSSGQLTKITLSRSEGVGNPLEYYYSNGGSTYYKSR